MKYGKSKLFICEIKVFFPGYSENSNIQEAYLPKTIVHPRFDQLTAVKTVYLLTSIAG